MQMCNKRKIKCFDASIPLQHMLPGADLISQYKCKRVFQNLTTTLNGQSDKNKTKQNTMAGNLRFNTW